MYTIKDLYDLDHTLAKDYLSQFTYPWEALKGIKDMILQLGPTLGDDYEEVSENVWVHKTAKVFPSAYLGAPCIIGPNTEVRHGAFIRSSALVGADCVVGNSVELKNVILFDHVQTPHYNYVGDSILGYYSHMGAGSITSNVKSDKTLVVVKDGDEKIGYYGESLILLLVIRLRFFQFRCFVGNVAFKVCDCFSESSELFEIPCIRRFRARHVVPFARLEFRGNVGIPLRRQCFEARLIGVFSPCGIIFQRHIPALE